MHPLSFLWLLPLFVLITLVIRQRLERRRRIRRASRFNHRLMSYHEQLNTQRGLFTRRGCACVDLLFPLALACLLIAAGLAAWIALDEITRHL